jgi:chromosome segregation ATPase
MEQAMSATRTLDPETSEPVLELQPRPGMRVVGPGRKERAYQVQIAELGRRAADLSGQLGTTRRELEVARLVERGTDRLVGRLEQRLERADAQKARALVLVGGLQAELEATRERLALAEAKLRQLPAPRRGWMSRLLGR